MNLFSLTKTHLISHHSVLKQSCTCCIVGHYYITDLPSMVAFKSLGNNISFTDFVIASDVFYPSNLPGFNASKDLLSPVCFK